MIVRSALLALVMAAGLSVPAQAQERPAVPAIQNTITAQLNAFVADDLTGAFSHASPTIKQAFRTPENFGAMVRNGYPMVWRPAETRYLELREVAGTLWQRVMITDTEGQTHLLDYQMIPGPDGWQINAVQLLESPPPSV
ncbi:DUF4864 domain-containing protein [Chachezhania antarctica]|uniref:DUF4864 domain-containing protein n=1 Tax=Chachezhania antarctica TaxID=2340860 RepID=UPI000EB33DF6|nr:DUF4864 domain-containing protein [Chachezhania antarctica]|tara:strand:+ start:69 stop:488 length:420 start_codon:yes stop_codon:yes gene_type:complete